MIKKENTKNYTTAPLPFMGQKRRFLKAFKAALNDYPKDATYIDLFGGSGLLSHTIKQQFAEARVIYNDFDNYTERLKNIDNTNRILTDLREILKDYPKDKMIKNDHRELVLNRIKQEKGFVDYITLSSSILFSMNYVSTYDELCAQSLYNCVRKSEYNAVGYLKGVESVTKDYKVLFEEFKNNENIVFLVDPPYLSTEVGTYKTYWKLKDYLDVLNVLDGTKYFYFTSNKSNIIELCEWIETKTPMSNPFNNSLRTDIQTTITSTASYTDIMIYKYDLV
ncbi:DNA adenine methylase [Flavobacterium sp. '19STA2R22 D10 B1']|uniref:DNA adenine methylase n=1 Tax=Flavobacterium aerium TaxID=3037261 RepID=UPI00278C0038|nr:DNA adenine methylase [Flavobacterium sp. '19STA2R22 D10 B1']